MQQPGLRAPSREGWKRDIVRQLKHRDQNQHAMFTDLIRFYTQLLDKTSLAKGILSRSARRPSADGSSIMTLLHRNNQLKKTTGELAYQVVELQQKIKIKERFLEEQHARLSEDERRAGAVFDARQELQQRVEQVQGENGALKMEYDALLERQRGAETRLREENLRGGHLLEDIMHMKKQAATRMNSRNERKSRAREANLQRELQSAAKSKVTVDSSSAPTSRSTSPKNQNQESKERGHTRLFRSASATSPRILTSIKELFDRKRRGHSVCSLEEDLSPVGICLYARVPVRARQVLMLIDDQLIHNQVN
ncbi:Autophagy-related protein 16-2 APG16-like 2 [Larimichthys crocea]|uniref:Autophagy-related protein 16-2 APG16-like 2 n=1 Tax=Larimichthys crocea TaxID=215358 RepID=A0A6G0ITG5_LARCR|nr:Autophagy-related protein 16-2 APG16-like 2 [Larimichthys crocea]